MAAVGRWIHACTAGMVASLGSDRHGPEWSTSPPSQCARGDGRGRAVSSMAVSGTFKDRISLMSNSNEPEALPSLYIRHAYPHPVSSSFSVEFDQMMEVRIDEKWKLSRKGSGGNARRGGGGAAAKRRSTAESSLSRRCGSLVREQRAKFYIVRRCVVMLICWRD